MGAKATKIEGEYLPDTPTLRKLRLVNQSPENVEMSTPTREQNNVLLDPRSPNGCRTPLNFLQSESQIPQMSEMVEQAPSENAFSQLRKRLLKGFSLSDPRSPQLNRTPLVLDEVRSLNLDDTFADLFVDTRAPTTRAVYATPPLIPSPSQTDESCDSFGTPPSTHNNSSLEIVSLTYDEEDTMPCEAQLQKTPPPPQLQETPPQLHFDPRSPSVGVDRTPIMFCDDEDEEAREAQMLEQILETLTLNLSAGGSSMASFADSAVEPNADPSTAMPANKHLERVRLGHKRRVPPRKPARASKPKIYVDQEEESPSKVGARTPTSNTTPLAAQKRTPLSCVKNRPHLRSRSTEKELQKTPLPLHSLEDQLNLAERCNF